MVLLYVERAQKGCCLVAIADDDFRGHKTLGGSSFRRHRPKKNKGATELLEDEELPLTFDGQFGGRDKEPELIEMKIITTDHNLEGSDDEEPGFQPVSNFDDDFPLRGRSPQQTQQQHYQQLQEQHLEQLHEPDDHLTVSLLQEVLRSQGMFEQDEEDNATNYVEEQKKQQEHNLHRNPYQFDDGDNESTAGQQQGECGRVKKGLEETEQTKQPNLRR